MHCRYGTRLLESGCGFSCCILSSFSRVQLFVIQWIIAFQAPLSVRFSRQEYWTGLPCPPPGDLPNPKMEPRSPALWVHSLLTEPPGKPKNTGVGSLSLLQGTSWPRIEPGSPALQADSLPVEPLGKPFSWPSESQISIVTLWAKARSGEDGAIVLI